MKKSVYSGVILLLLGIFLVGSVQAQSVSKTVSNADKYFKIRNYDEALKLYLEAIEAGEGDALVYYNTGVCYEQSFEINEQVKAIPYFEQAIKLAKDQLPPKLLFNLAAVYHLDGQVEKAIDYYQQYKATLKNERAEIQKVDRALEIANNALIMMSSPKDISIHNFGQVINSSYTEYNPVVSADESVMAYTALRPNTGKTRSNEEFIEEVYISYNESGTWSQPQKIEITSNYNVGTAGLSADGQRMLIFIGAAEGAGNLYSIDKSGKDWSIPTTLGPKINTTRHLESTASITPDGKTMYFASNRPGGYGGLDIYQIKKLESGDWGDPVNLGPEVNSKYNEDAPFIHPDQWTLFFTSDGHNTIGGRDIFVTRLFNDEWTKPENMGYPINTTADDNYFTLTADGRKGYFSSNRKGGNGGQDIYTIDMPEEEANVPLTMVKGRILDGETGQPMPTQIYMIDNESGKKLDFVYQPDPKTGNYLIILPPAKNYDMIIESEGFLPYTLNINVPGQTYFYELFQMIYLKTIKQFDVVVGQSVEVKNAFYDTHEDAVTDFRKTHESALIKSDSIDVYDLMNDLIAASDEKGIEYLTSLIYMTNSIDEVNFDSSQELEQATRVYYYDESDESKFEKKEVDGKTIFSLPTMYVTEEAEKQKAEKAAQPVTYDKTLLNKVTKLYFDVSKSDLKASYNAELDKLIEALNKYPDLGVQISGYASAEGNEEFNRKLSNERAIAVLDYINQKGVVRRRIIAKAFGATKNASGNAEESRRVEVELVPLDQARR
ncbi:OmpA family protein [Fulvivirga lutimaris]|uniref:OmpA family protein n=1 Tax=Fulvivirga lutimaris TaxID=1819566 RepID=UPI0012BD3285|nr:OmpA family protein [Fulvivirga lutimaris]MTI40672.1 tetratricopeptide repeat protein [Fulvivirga lutimaris]